MYVQKKDTKLYMANCLELSKNSDITSNFFFKFCLSIFSDFLNKHPV